MAFSYKRLGGQAENPGSNPSTYYTVPEGKSAIVSTLHVCNTTNAPATFSVWIFNVNDGLDDFALWAKDVPIAANGIFSASEGITVEAGVRFAVSANPAYSLNFHLFGTEVDA